jgi:hypothetical protein
MARGDCRYCRSLTNLEQPSSGVERKGPTVAALHAEVDGVTHRLHVLHATRLHCQRGCSACCVDDLTVFDAEADLIRAHHGELLARGVAGPEGGCAFLAHDGACRIYAERPYVCRTQGLPIRWIEEACVDDAGRGRPAVELRDICPLNEAGPGVETLPAEDCWTIGPIEVRLARLQIEGGGAERRTRLRDLFVSTTSD